MNGFDIADLLAITLSGAALATSIVALVFSRRSERHALFVRLHETLTSEVVQEGRRLLSERVTGLRSPDKLRTKEPESYAKINHAVGALNTLASFTRSGDVDERVVLKHWREPLVAAWPAIEIWIRFRRTHYANAWDALVWLARRAGASPAEDLG